MLAPRDTNIERIALTRLIMTIVMTPVLREQPQQQNLFDLHIFELIIILSSKIAFIAIDGKLQTRIEVTLEA